MLYYALVFFVVALIAAFFGFSGIAASSVGIAKVVFIGFMIAAAIGAAFHFLSSRRKLGGLERDGSPGQAWRRPDMAYFHVHAGGIALS